jgi:hypothetical protein
MCKPTVSTITLSVLPSLGYVQLSPPPGVAYTSPLQQKLPQPYSLDLVSICSISHICHLRMYLCK